MSYVEGLRARWGVGPWSIVAILLAFALAGSTTVWLKDPIIGFFLPGEAPTWVAWLVYLIIMLPVYQVLLLGYGTLLGQGRFFWGKMKALGRHLSRAVG